MSFFSERLKSARGNRSQQCVAEAVGIKQQAYARYESEKATPGIDILAKLCRVLDVSSDYLLGLSNEEEGCHPVINVGGGSKANGKTKKRKSA